MNQIAHTVNQLNGLTMQWIIDIVKFKLASYLKNKIFFWSGAIVDIPDGWALCDGTQGTPNLKDKFIVGAGSSYNPADEGGSMTHGHIFGVTGIFHILLYGTDIETGTDFSKKTGTHTLGGTTLQSSILAPYYALAFIMKL